MSTITCSKSLALSTPHESSVMQSARSADDVRQAWKRQTKQRDQILDYGVAIDNLARKVETMRRRMLGGTGSSTVSTGYQGEYDPTKSYDATQTFKITAPLTITVSGTPHVIVAGFYGVRPAASVADSQGFGPWAGTLPANPSTAGIDMDKMFFNPGTTAPTLGASPNDKLYAELLGAYC